MVQDVGMALVEARDEDAVEVGGGLRAFGGVGGVGVVLMEAE